LNKEVIQPLTKVFDALEEFAEGVTSFVELPLRFVETLGDIASLVLDTVGGLVNDAVTIGINQLRKVRRMLYRIINSADMFRSNMDMALQDYKRFHFELPSDDDSDKALEEKRYGANSISRGYAQDITKNEYRGTRKVRVKKGQTLQKISIRELGTANQWRDIAILNNLSGSDALVVGTDILVPGTTSLDGSQVGGLRLDRYTSEKDEEERLFGRDFRLYPDKNGYLDVKFGPNNDLVTVGGKENLKQAVMLKSRIKQGQLIEEPEYGLRDIFAKRSSRADLLLLKHGLKVSAESDSRIEKAEVKVESVENVTKALYELYPIGQTGRQPLGSVVGQI
jgi:LysM repeat protein